MKISASIVVYNENKETLQKVIKSFMALKYPKELIFESEEIEKFLATVYASEDISLATPLVCNEDRSIQNIVRELPTPLGLIKRKLQIEWGEIKIKINKFQEVPFTHGCFYGF